MFNKNQLKTIAAALVVQEKSVNRLAAKEGQPESVAAEYRKVAVEIAAVMKAVNAELAGMESDKKSKKSVQGQDEQAAGG